MSETYPAEPWDYAPAEPGLADTWIGGEPDFAAQVVLPIDDDCKTPTTILWADVDMEPEAQDAIVRRVVACVNACAGVPTEALEAFARGGVFADLWRDEWEDAFNRH